MGKPTRKIQVLHDPTKDDGFMPHSNEQLNWRFFGHFVFLSLYRDVTLRQFMLRNHDKATEIYYLKNHGYSSSKITLVVFGIGYSQVLEYPWQPYP